MTLHKCMPAPKIGQTHAKRQQRLRSDHIGTEWDEAHRRNRENETLEIVTRAMRDWGLRRGKIISSDSALQSFDETAQSDAPLA
jgi:hypothetical protein